MELSLLLGKVIALFLIIESLLLLVRRKDFPGILRGFKKNAALILEMGVIETIAALFVIISHNIWESNWQIIVTIFGWLMLIEGLSILFLPDLVISYSKKFTNRKVVLATTILLLVIGLYLGAKTFGLT